MGAAWECLRSKMIMSRRWVIWRSLLEENPVIFRKYPRDVKKQAKPSGKLEKQSSNKSLQEFVVDVEGKDTLGIQFNKWITVYSGNYGVI